MANPSAAYLTSLFSLAGRTAVVTGASAGIGRAMALSLAQAGARLILVARRPEPLEETATSFRSAGLDATPLPADVSDTPSLSNAIERILSLTSGQGPDILVNAAAVNLRPPMDDLTQEDWDATITANLTAPYRLGQAFGPRMAARRHGRIINVVSQQAFRAYGNSGAYGASKAGLVGLTRSQAEAWSRHGVLCNAVAPGVVHTAMTAHVLADPDKSAVHERRTMIGRNGRPDDFAGVAVWLASRANEAVTGQTIFVDGGYSAT
ncbi:NAD(P)-binding protein [Sodiomyces alkalinus F11]|uniref:NAD(P)-binding protein n=1 Tax=Sodiomyces alkalinus (strain CBS 110278 / VKM F-3762 / F11) TaxID=1314773 RepID=A0A3N2PPP8_SODAK|nr:NAD(P)-binding protein [Sodiomyces alkalinus F11]ROT36483.1 NAD(P)-binding protein [Sodiomyces alkalinus F11]